MAASTSLHTASKPSTPPASKLSNGSTSPARPSRPHYEWMGPPGALFIMLSVPAVIYALYFLCSPQHCLSLTQRSWHGGSWLSLSVGSARWWSWRAFAVYVCWLLLHFVLYLLVPGSRVRGVPLDKQGNRLDYSTNGLLCGVLSLALLAALVWLGVLPSTFAYDEFVPLVTSSLVVAVAMSTALYVSSLHYRNDGPDSYLSTHGQTGNTIYDFFVGRPLNPRLLGVDLKYVCELRPGMVGWVAINASMMAAQWREQGQVTASLLLVVVFQLLYVLDSLISEAAILTTMDITTDGFGYMLVFGDLCWVPFTYSTQARYLVDRPTHLQLPLLVAVVALKLAGLLVFRSSNSQKNDFRSSPHSAFTRSARYLQTSNGSRLLLSGWWGRSRHANYFGDLLMAASWCLPCLFDSPIPWFYLVYFTVLLVHRQRRDDDKCSRKYEKDWDAYCKLVPYRIVPYVY